MKATANEKEVCREYKGIKQVWKGKISDEGKLHDRHAICIMQNHFYLLNNIKVQGFYLFYRIILNRF